MEKETIKWFKIRCSLYQQEFGIRFWRDVVDFVDKHCCFDIDIKGQTSELFSDVDAFYVNGVFEKINVERFAD